MTCPTGQEESKLRGHMLHVDQHICTRFPIHAYAKSSHNKYGKQ
jgi:hypothetical protein